MAQKNKARHAAEKTSIEVSLAGNVSGQVAVGENIRQTQTVQTGVGALTEPEREALFALVAALKRQVANEAPPEQKDPAMEKIEELEQALIAEKPDVSTLEHVKDWFVRNIPQLAGAVTGLIVNPIVGKLVEAAGETVAHEFKRRFGTA